MKQIKLIRYTPPVKHSPRTADQFFYVSLGNGLKKEFSNKKETLAFLSETNRALNQSLYELNFLYSDLLRLYRSSWLYFDKNKITGLNNIEVLCTSKFTAIENSFNLLVDRSSWENGNYTVFNHFSNIIAEIQDVCNLLQKVFKNRGVTAALYETESFILRSEYISTAVTIYPNKIKLVGEQIHQRINYLKAV